MIGSGFTKGLFKFFSKAFGKVDKNTKTVIQQTEKAKIDDTTLSKPTVDVNDILNNTIQTFTINSDEFNKLIGRNERGTIKGLNKESSLQEIAKESPLTNAKVSNKTVTVSFNTSDNSGIELAKGFNRLLEEQGLTVEELNREKKSLNLFRKGAIKEILSKDPSKRINEINEHIGNTLAEKAKSIGTWVGLIKGVWTLYKNLGKIIPQESRKKIKNLFGTFMSKLKDRKDEFVQNFWIPLWRTIIPQDRYQKLPKIGRFIASLLTRYDKFDFNNEAVLKESSKDSMEEYNKKNGTSFKSWENVKQSFDSDAIMNNSLEENIQFNPEKYKENRPKDGSGYSSLGDYIRKEAIYKKDNNGKIILDKNGKPELIKDSKTLNSKNYLNIRFDNRYWNTSKGPIILNGDYSILDLLDNVQSEIDLIELLKLLSVASGAFFKWNTITFNYATKNRRKNNFINTINIIDSLIPEDYPDYLVDSVKLHKIKQVIKDLKEVKVPKAISDNDQLPNDTKEIIGNTSSYSKLSYDGIDRYLTYLTDTLNERGISSQSYLKEQAQNEMTFMDENSKKSFDITSIEDTNTDNYNVVSKKPTTPSLVESPNYVGTIDTSNNSLENPNQYTTTQARQIVNQLSNDISTAIPKIENDIEIINDNVETTEESESHEETNISSTMTVINADNGSPNITSDIYKQNKRNTQTNFENR